MDPLHLSFNRRQGLGDLAVLCLDLCSCSHCSCNRRQIDWKDAFAVLTLFDWSEVWYTKHLSHELMFRKKHVHEDIIGR